MFTAEIVFIKVIYVNFLIEEVIFVLRMNKKLLFIIIIVTLIFFVLSTILAVVPYLMYRF